VKKIEFSISKNEGKCNTINPNSINHNKNILQISYPTTRTNSSSQLHYNTCNRTTFWPWQVKSLTLDLTASFIISAMLDNDDEFTIIFLTSKKIFFLSTDIDQKDVTGTMAVETIRLEPSDL